MLIPTSAFKEIVLLQYRFSNQYNIRISALPWGGGGGGGGGGRLIEYRRRLKDVGAY